MWTLTLGNVLAVFRLLTPTLLLDYIWGNQSFVAKFLRRVETSLRSIVYSGSRRGEAALCWLQESSGSSAPLDGVAALWRRGDLLCRVIDGAAPGACSGHAAARVTLAHAQILAQQYLGIDPVFTNEELEYEELTKSLEWKLSEYIISIRNAIGRISPPVSKPSSPRNTRDLQAYTLDYVAKGSGLINAHVNKSATFKIYPTAQQGFEPGDISVIIRGPYDSYGTITVPAILGRTHFVRSAVFGIDRKPQSKSTQLLITNGTLYSNMYKNVEINKAYYIPKNKCDIKICVLVQNDHAKVSYTPSTAGQYEITLISKGCSIVGAPFTVEAIKNTFYNQESSPELDEEEECEIIDIRKNRKVVFRIVDFVTEKMLLTENGTLEKISNDEANQLLSYTKSKDLKKRTINQIFDVESECNNNMAKQKYSLKYFVNKVILILKICRQFRNNSHMKLSLAVTHNKEEVEEAFIQDKVNEPTTNVEYRSTPEIKLKKESEITSTPQLLIENFNYECDSNSSNNSLTEDTTYDHIQKCASKTFLGLQSNNNPFVNNGNIERPKTPVLKILTNDLHHRPDTPFFDTQDHSPECDKDKVHNTEKIYIQTINPVLMTEKNVDLSPSVTDFVIGAPVSLPPILKVSPEPDMDSVILASCIEESLSKYRVMDDDDNERQYVDSLWYSSQFSLKSDTLDNDTVHNSGNIDTYNVDTSTHNTKYYDQVNDFPLASPTSINKPTPDMWDSAYVSIDENSIALDNSKEIPLDVEFNLNKYHNNPFLMGPAELEIWQSMSNTNQDISVNHEYNEGMFINKYMPKISSVCAFTTISEENENIGLSGKQSVDLDNDSPKIKINHDDIEYGSSANISTGEIAAAFSELNNILDHYSSDVIPSIEDDFQNTTMNSENQIKIITNTSQIVDSASEKSDVKRQYEEDFFFVEKQDLISEVQTNAAESYSVSQSNINNDDFNQIGNQIDAQIIENTNTDVVRNGNFYHIESLSLSDSSTENVNEKRNTYENHLDQPVQDKSSNKLVLEKKKYWDEKIKLIQESKKSDPVLQHTKKKPELSYQNIEKTEIPQINNELRKEDPNNKNKTPSQVMQINTEIKAEIIDQKTEEVETIEHKSGKLVEKWKKYWDAKLELLDINVLSESKTHLCSDTKSKIEYTRKKSEVENSQNVDELHVAVRAEIRAENEKEKVLENWQLNESNINNHYKVYTNDELNKIIRHDQVRNDLETSDSSIPSFCSEPRKIHIPLQDQKHYLLADTETITLNTQYKNIEETETNSSTDIINSENNIDSNDFLNEAKLVKTVKKIWEEKLESLETTQNTTVPEISKNSKFINDFGNKIKYRSSCNNTDNIEQYTILREDVECYQTNYVKDIKKLWENSETLPSNSIGKLELNFDIPRLDNNEEKDILPNGTTKADRFLHNNTVEVENFTEKLINAELCIEKLPIQDTINSSKLASQEINLWNKNHDPKTNHNSDEKLFQAFETSPKRFFGKSTSMKNILQRFDNGSTDTEKGKDNYKVFSNRSSLVAERVLEFTSKTKSLDSLNEEETDDNSSRVNNQRGFFKNQCKIKENYPANTDVTNSKNLNLLTNEMNNNDKKIPNKENLLSKCKNHFKFSLDEDNKVDIPKKQVHGGENSPSEDDGLSFPSEVRRNSVQDIITIFEISPESHESRPKQSNDPIKDIDSYSTQELISKVHEETGYNHSESNGKSQAQENSKEEFSNESKDSQNNVIDGKLNADIIEEEEILKKTKETFMKARTFFASLEDISIKSQNTKMTNSKTVSDNADECKNHKKHKTKKRCKAFDSANLERFKDDIHAISAPTSDNEYDIISLSDQWDASYSVGAGGRRLKKISEKFQVRDLFKDIAGDKTLRRKGSFRGIPHKDAVLAAFRSMENLTGSHLTSYEISDSHMSEFTEANHAVGKQTFQNEYPYLPKTDPSKYRSRVDTKAYGLISRKELLKQESTRKRRNSVPDRLRLNESFVVNI